MISAAPATMSHDRLPPLLAVMASLALAALAWAVVVLVVLAIRASVG